MATAAQISATYDYMDEWWRLSLGEHADITCALFDGDFSLSLDEAQKRKHSYILSTIRFQPGQRVLDIGCGWGGLVRDINEAGGKGTGITLSTAQARHCKSVGLDVHIQDWRTLGRSLGTFDNIVSVGAFEHFCSKEEYIAGKQEQIYQDFFALAADLLPPGGRIFVQTMTWGDKVPDTKSVQVNAPKGSEERILGHLERFFPGSWLPSGLDQITKCAKGFELVAVKNGRLDYIETLHRWSRQVASFDLAKVLPAIRVLRYAFTDRDFFRRMETLYYGYNRQCFERRIMDHYRITLERQ